MAEPMPASELDAIRERGPVGYHCDHSDEPSANSSHYAWEWVEGEGLVFQPAPSVSMSLTHPKNRAGSGESQQCPRAVPVYAVDAPALLAEVDRLTAELAEALAKLAAVAKVKAWVDQDDRRFVYVSDLATALGSPSPTTQEEA